MQLNMLVNQTSGLPQPGREGLVSQMRWDVLGGLAEYCLTAGSDRPSCANLNPTTGLPTGPQFDEAVWHMLAEDFVSAGALTTRVRLPFLLCEYFNKPLHADTPAVQTMHSLAAAETVL